MIPNIIHYCWFGGNEKPNYVLKCIDTWSAALSNYEIMEWNEETFPIDYCTYCRQAYVEKKYAFISDVARLYALYKYGGIYFDTDIIVRKSMNEFLSSDLLLAFESKTRLMSAFIASSRFNPVIKELLDTYADRLFIKEDGSLDLTPNTKIITDHMKTYGLIANGKTQKLASKIDVYNCELFGAFDADNSVYVNNNDTILIHKCNASWMDSKTRKLFILRRIAAKVLGKDTYIRIKKIVNSLCKRVIIS